MLLVYTAKYLCERLFSCCVSARCTDSRSDDKQVGYLTTRLLSAPAGSASIIRVGRQRVCYLRRPAACRRNAAYHPVAQGDHPTAPAPSVPIHLLLLRCPPPPSRSPPSYLTVFTPPLPPLAVPPSPSLPIHLVLLLSRLVRDRLVRD